MKRNGPDGQRWSGRGEPAKNRAESAVSCADTFGPRAAGGPATLSAMSLSGDDFLRLESLIYRPVSTRPDWLKAWRNEANYLLYLARRASDADDIELLEELEDQAREMADMVEARLRAEGL